MTSDQVDKVYVELNLCPGCNAFVSRTWTSCQACGHDLAIEQPVDAAHEEEPQTSFATSVSNVHGNTAEGFVVRWSSPPSTPAEPASEPVFATEIEQTSTVVPAVSTTPRKWSFTTATTEEPVAEQVVSVPEAPTAFVAPGTPSVAHFEEEKKSPSPAGMNSFSLNASAARLSDGRLAPALPKEVILAMAIAGPVVLVFTLIFAVAFLGGSASEESDKSGASVTENQTVVPETSDAPTWISYEDPHGKFKVELPATPEVVTENNQTGPLVHHFSKTANGRTQTSVITLDLGSGHDGKDDPQILKNVVKAASERSGMEIKGQVTTEVDGRQQVDVHFVGGGSSMDLRYFVKGQTLYGVGVATNDVDGDPQTFNKLMTSFVLK